MRHGKLDFDGVDPELGMHILSLHRNHQHHSFLATYRPALMRDMARGGPAGVIHAETVLGLDCNGEIRVDKAAVFRTARRLFEGNVFYRYEATPRNTQYSGIEY